jgi:hypothetical protein
MKTTVGENLLLGLSVLSLAWMGFADKSLMRGGNFNTLKIGDIAIVKVNLPDADFWLQRRGSEKTVGTVSRTFTNAEDIGIKIKPEYLSVINPTHLSYVFEHFFNQGYWDAISRGTLALKNIRVSDVKEIPLQFGSSNTIEIGSGNKTPRATRKRIVRLAEKIFNKKYARKCGTLTSTGGNCPFWALAVIEAGKREGRRLVLQAGSLQWRYVPPQLDDGVSSTHFSYMWSPNDPRSRQAIAMGMLPEVHVWAADVDTQEIIDLSTRELKTIAETRYGLDWKTADPPNYVWMTRDEYLAQPDANYSANREATLLVYRMLEQAGLL